MSATGSSDPSSTYTLREREFRPALTGRFRALITAIRTTVIDNDALALKQDAREGPFAGTLTAAADDIDPADRFRFRTDAEAAGAFDDWLTRQLDRGVLERVPGQQVLQGGHYTGPYIRSAADRGWEDAARRLREQGVDVESEDLAATFERGVPREQLQTLYTRTFNELEGVTDATQQAIRRELTQGLAEGVGPRVMARRLTDRTKAIGITRAEAIARTETLRSYNETALTRFERSGVMSVTAKVEWLTAGDRRVCPECATLGGSQYTIQEARGKLPLHVSCRCCWIPVVKT